MPDPPKPKAEKPTSKLTKKMKSSMQKEELKVNIADLQKEDKDEFDGENFYDKPKGIFKTLKPGESPALRIGDSVQDDRSESAYNDDMDFGKNRTSNSPMGSQFTQLVGKESSLAIQPKRELTPPNEEDERCEHGKKMKKVVKQIFF